MAKTTARNEVVAQDSCGTWVAKVTWTPDSGPLAGRTLKGGEYLPKGCTQLREPCVRFPKFMNPGQKGDVLARLAGKADLQALVDGIPAAVGAAKAARREEERREREALGGRLRLLLEDAPAYGLELCEGYLGEGDELKDFAAWTHGRLHFRAPGRGKKLSRRHTPTLERVLGDNSRIVGFFSGCENTLRSVTREEWDTIIREQAGARDVRAAAEKARQDAWEAKVAALARKAAEEGRPQVLDTRIETDERPEDESSFSAVTRYVHADGRVTSEAAPCH
jgi:hypothetical protein